MQTSREKQDWQELLARLSELVGDVENADLENLPSQAKHLFDDVCTQLMQLQQRLKSIQDSQLSDPERLLAFISYRLRQAITVEDMLEDAATEVCHLLQVDHTIIHRFGAEWNVAICAESVGESQRSLLGEPVPSIYFEIDWLHCYERGIAKVVENIQTESLSPSAAASLINLGVKSSVAVAIPLGFRLAALLIIHQYESVRHWKDWEISFLEQLAMQLAIHLHQLSLLEQAQLALAERKQIEKELIHNALHDSLTGLPNRALLMERLQQACERVQTSPSSLFALLFLDFDRFKTINDSLGHLVGDHLLIAIAKRLKTCVHDSDTLARLGGDEFVILLDNIATPETSVLTAERILQALKTAFSIDNMEINMSVSIGIAVNNGNYANPNDMLRDADMAMYQAKQDGRARYVVFDPNLLSSTLVQFQLESNLRKALEQNQFSLYYQPIVSLNTNKLTGFEALLRWQHPTQGMILPTEFIPLAEEMGLIVELGQWVLYEACRQLQVWQAQFPQYPALTISVNVSGIQIMQYTFISQIEEMLQTVKIDPSCLKIEITETVLMKNVEACRSKLEALKSLGVQVYIDDFGTGYSSFGYLQDFPVDVLKIDRSFIKGLTADVNSRKIVQAIAALARNMGIKVIAEGVESSEQLAYLGNIGTELAQGYFISRPLEVNAVSDWLHSLNLLD